MEQRGRRTQSPGVSSRASFNRRCNSVASIPIQCIYTLAVSQEGPKTREQWSKERTTSPYLLMYGRKFLLDNMLLTAVLGSTANRQSLVRQVRIPCSSRKHLVEPS